MKTSLFLILIGIATTTQSRAQIDQRAGSWKADLWPKGLNPVLHQGHRFVPIPFAGLTGKEF